MILMRVKVKNRAANAWHIALVVVVCLIPIHRRAAAVRHQEIHKRRLAVWSTTSGFCVIMIITSGLLVSGFILF